MRRSTQCNNTGVNDPASFDTLSPADQERVLDWIFRRCLPSSRPNRSISSYGLKHLMESEIKLYVSNGAFKKAMVKSGYPAIDPGQMNWHFRICRVFDPRIRVPQPGAYNPRRMPSEAKR